MSVLRLAFVVVTATALLLYLLLCAPATLCALYCLCFGGCVSILSHSRATAATNRVLLLLCVASLCLLLSYMFLKSPIRPGTRGLRDVGGEGSHRGMPPPNVDADVGAPSAKAGTRSGSQCGHWDAACQARRARHLASLLVRHVGGAAAGGHSGHGDDAEYFHEAADEAEAQSFLFGLLDFLFWGWWKEWLGLGALFPHFSSQSDPVDSIVLSRDKHVAIAQPCSASMASSRVFVCDAPLQDQNPDGQPSDLCPELVVLLGGGAEVVGNFWSFDVERNGQVFLKVSDPVSSRTFSFRSCLEGIYRVVNVRDKYCRSDEGIGQTTVSRRGVPTADFLGGAEQCVGDRVTLELGPRLDLMSPLPPAGAPQLSHPWIVEYSYYLKNGSVIPVRETSLSPSVALQCAHPGVIVATSLSDSFCERKFSVPTFLPLPHGELYHPEDAAASEGVMSLRRSSLFVHVRQRPSAALVRAGTAPSVILVCPARSGGAAQDQQGVFVRLTGRPPLIVTYLFTPAWEDQSAQMKESVIWKPLSGADIRDDAQPWTSLLEGSWQPGCYQLLSVAFTAGGEGGAGSSLSCPAIVGSASPNVTDSVTVMLRSVPFARLSEGGEVVAPSDIDDQRQDHRADPFNNEAHGTLSYDPAVLSVHQLPYSRVQWLRIDLAGAAPWTVAIALARDSLEGHAEADTLHLHIKKTPAFVAVNIPGVYSVGSISDVFCSGEPSGSARVRVIQRSCARVVARRGSDGVKVSLQGSPPWLLHYQVVAASGRTFNRTMTAIFPVIHLPVFLSSSDAEGAEGESAGGEAYHLLDVFDSRGRQGVVDGRLLSLIYPPSLFWLPSPSMAAHHCPPGPAERQGGCAPGVGAASYGLTLCRGDVPRIRVAIDGGIGPYSITYQHKVPGAEVHDVKTVRVAYTGCVEEEEDVCGGAGTTRGNRKTTEKKKQCPNTTTKPRSVPRPFHSSHHMGWALPESEAGEYALLTLCDEGLAQCHGGVDRASVRVSIHPTTTIRLSGAGDGTLVFTSSNPASNVTVHYANTERTVSEAVTFPAHLAAVGASVVAPMPGDYVLVSGRDEVCAAAVSGSVRVLMDEGAQAWLSGDTEYCEGGSATITVSLLGTAPWTIAYSLTDTGSAVETDFDVVSSSRVYEIRVTAPTTVRLKRVIDGTGRRGRVVGTQCDHGLDDDSPRECSKGSQLRRESVATVRLRALPSGRLLGVERPDFHLVPLPAQACEGTVLNLQVQLVGEAPFTVTVRRTDEAGLESESVTRTLTPGPLSVALFPVQVSGTYSLLDLSDNHCRAETLDDHRAAIRLHRNPKLVVTSPALKAQDEALAGSVCVNAAVTIELMGDGPWDVTLQHWAADVSLREIVDGVAGEEDSKVVRVVSKTHDLMLAQLGWWRVAAVVDVGHGCAATLQPPIVVLVRHPPSLTIAPHPPSLCLGHAVLALHFNGLGPFALTYSYLSASGDPPQTRAISDISSASLDWALPRSGVYHLTSVSDLRCSAELSDEGSVVEVVGPPSVGVVDLLLPYRCDYGEPLRSQGGITLRLSGKKPWTVDYLKDGVPTSVIIENSVQRLSPSLTGHTFQLTGVADSMSCGAGVVERAEAVSLLVRHVPTVKWENDSDETYCVRGSVEREFPIHVTGTLPVTFLVSFSPDAGGNEVREVSVTRCHSDEATVESDHVLGGCVYRLPAFLTSEGGTIGGTYRLLGVKDRYCRYCSMGYQRSGGKCEWQDGH